MSWYIHCDTSYSKNKLAANMKGFDYSLQFIHCRESWKWISTEVNDPYPNEQLLHVIAEEKSAVELRYLCCINFHLFYKRKRVTNPDVILYVLTTDSTHSWSARTQVNSSFFLTRIFFCCTVSTLWYLLIQQSCSLYVYNGKNPQLQKFQTQG